MVLNAGLLCIERILRELFYKQIGLWRRSCRWLRKWISKLVYLLSR